MQIKSADIFEFCIRGQYLQICFLPSSVVKLLDWLGLHSHWAEHLDLVKQTEKISAGCARSGDSGNKIKPDYNVLLCAAV